MMLKHMNLSEYGNKIEKAVLATIAEGKVLTGDLGGRSKCSEFTDAIIKSMERA